MLNAQFLESAFPWIIVALVAAILLRTLFALRQRRGAEAAMLVAVALMAGAFTADSAFAIEGSDVVQPEDSYVNTQESVQLMLGNDFVWLGDTLVMSAETTSNDVLAAGHDIQIASSLVQGGVRVAGEKIAIDDTTVKQSAIMAGRIVSFQNSTATSVALAGEEITYSGETTDAYLAAKTVRIDGVIHGNAHVSAENLILGDNAVIEGTLFGELSEEPAIATGAQVDESELVFSETDTGDISAILTGLGTSLAIASLILGVLGVLIVALLSEWLLRRQTQDSAAMCKGRTAPMLVSGLLGALAAPVLLVMLLCTVVGIPLAIALFFLLVALQMLALGFTAASMARMAFPTMGRYKAAMLMGLIAGVASAVPVLGSVLSIASFMYVLGYVLQRIFLGMRTSVVAGPQPPAPGQPGGPGQPFYPDQQPMPSQPGIPTQSAIPGQPAGFAQPQSAPTVSTPSGSAPIEPPLG